MMHTNTRLLLTLLFMGVSVAPLVRAEEEFVVTQQNEQVEVDEQEYEYIDGVKCPCNKPKPSRKLLVTSVPRSGETLVHVVVDELIKPNWVALEEDKTELNSDVLNKLVQEGKVVASYIHADENAMKIAHDQQLNVIYVVKDPRDYVHAAAHWIKNSGHKDGAATKSVNELVSDLIKEVDQLYRSHTPWMTHSRTHVVRIEQLIDEEQAQEEILNIARYLNVAADKHKAMHIAHILSQKFDGSYKNGAGTWKEEFTHDHKELFKRVAGKLLIDLGYEKDLNW